MRAHIAFPRSIRFKFPFFVLLPVVLVILITAVSLFHFMARRTYQARSRNLQNNLITTANHLRILLIGPERVVRRTAMGIEAYPVERPIDYLYSTIETTLEANPDFQSLNLAFVNNDHRAAKAAYVYRQGSRLARSDLKASKSDYAKEPWFLRAVESGESSWSGPHLDFGGQGIWVSSYCVPFRGAPDARGERRIWGVVTLEMPLSQIRQSLQSIAPNSAEFLLVDPQGGVLLGPDSQVLSQPAWRSFASRAQQHETGLSRLPTSDGEALAATGPVMGTPWGLGMWVPMGVVLRDANQRHAWVLGSQLLLALVIAAAVWMVTRWLTSPLLLLTEEVKLFGQGSRPPSRAIPADDEIGDLGRALHEMMGLLDERQEKIRLLESQRFNQLVANVPGVVFRYNCKTRLPEYVSESVEALTGIPRDHFLVMPSPRSLIVEEDRETVTAVVRAAIRERRPWRLDFRLQTSDGQIRWIEERSLATYFEDGSPQFVDGILQDITDRKNLENELRQARIEADGASQAKTDFLANMSHEIRTPMNAVIGLTHLALQTELNLKQRDYLNKVNSSAQSLLGIINEILDFSKIEAGQMTMEQVDFRLDEVLDGVLNLFSVRASEKSVELFVVPDHEVPIYLVGDPMRLSQVLINLTSNALKFTEKGEIVIRARLVERDQTMALLSFSVADSGIGLSTDQIERIFRSFSQADTSTTRRFGGTGLGLSICKRLVEMMGGEIKVDSQPGKGSTFQFEVRFKLAERENFASSSSWQSLDLRGSRVLVVDDNPTARTIMTELLESLSFEVKAVASGPEAIEEVEKHPDYAAVLMDWQMPRMSGIEASNAIRQLYPKGTGPALIMVTNYGRDEVRAQANKLDLDGFLIKPVTPSQLFDSIASALAGDSVREAEPASTSLVVADEPAHAALKGARVLLVEDNPISQQVAREMLEQAGVVVQVAGNGLRALEALRTDGPFAVVLMDVQMPEMDGYAATGKIRNELGLTDLPVVAMTAHALTGDRERCLEAGMNDHITKPIDPRRLYATLASILGRSVPLPESVTPTAPFQCLDIDMEAGVERLGGNRGLYLRLLEEFREQFQDCGQKFGEMAESQDWPGLLALAHSLAGVAGNLAMPALEGAAREMESAARRGLLGDLMALKGALAKTLSAMAAPAESVAGDLPVSTQTGPALLEQLPELWRRLREGDPSAESLLPPLEHELQGRLTQGLAGLWKKLGMQVRGFDLEEAAVTVEDLAKSLGIALEESA